MSRSSTVVGDYPQTADCLSWSHDGMLAVALRDHVDIYIPRHGEALPGNEDRFKGELRDWDRVQFQTNLWTFPELPRVRITSSKVLSIGEEQSESEIAAIKWSLPGLARHSRCALAVFTTNLRLSLWAPLGDPRQSAGWRRVLILNPAIARCLSIPEPVLEGETIDETEPRLRTRIRAFAWSHPTRDSAKLDVNSQRGPYDWSDHLLVVSNEYDEVLILRVYTDKGTQSTLSWAVDLLACFSLPPTEAGAGAESSLDLGELCRSHSHVTDLAWSPWSSHGGTLVSVIAFTTQSKLHFRRIHLIKDEQRPSSIQVDPKDIAHETSIIHEGRPWSPLVWLPKVAMDGQLTFVTFSMDCVMNVEIDISKEGKMRVLQRTLGGRLDAVTGAVFTPHEGPYQRVSATTLFSTANEVPLQLVLPLDAEQPKELPNWQKHIREHRKLYGVHHDLGDHVIVKTWGLTGSPMGDLVATCCSTHPSDSIEYKIPVIKEYVISMSPVKEASATFSVPASLGYAWVEDISMEALSYYVKRWISKQPGSPESIETTKEVVLQELLRTFGQRNSHIERKNHIDRMSGRELRANLKHSIMMLPEPLELRLRTMLDIVCNPENTTRPQRKQTAKLYLSTLGIFLPQTDGASDAAWRILATVSQAQAGLSGQAISSGSETCEICRSPIPFSNIGMAYCQTGHRFVRCGLTFLAIQAPGITKTCGLCGMQALNGTASLGVGETAPQSSDMAPFEDVLFAACDVCIYCGGKYLSSNDLSGFSGKARPYTRRTYQDKAGASGPYD